MSATTPAASGGISDTARTWLGVALAGGVLLIVAEHAPRVALGLAGLLALGAVMSNGKQIGAILDAFTHATGH